MTERIEQEPVPYSVTFEGKVMPDKLPELLSLLGEISVEQHVSYQIGEPEEEPAQTEGREIFRADFDEICLNRTGAGQAWSRLRKAIDRDPDSPLEVIHGDDGKTVWLRGDVAEALVWLKKNPMKGAGSHIAVSALEALLHQ